MYNYWLNFMISIYKVRSGQILERDFTPGATSTSTTHQPHKSKNSSPNQHRPSVAQQLASAASYLSSTKTLPQLPGMDCYKNRTTR